MPKTRHSPASARELPPVRALGNRIEDLDIDFTAKDQVSNVIELVHRYSEFPDEDRHSDDWAWDLPIGARVLQLLRILQSSTSDTALPLVSRCPNRACNERLEMEIPIAALAEHGGHALQQGPTLSVETETRRVIALRRPTGRDQRNWIQRQFEQPADTAETLFQTLVVDDTQPDAQLDPELEAALSDALVDFDPLVAFRIATECPSCRRQSQIPVDIERACLARLARLQNELLNAVHRLASRYSWSEERILALSPRRRAFYLSRIQDEEDDL